MCRNIRPLFNFEPPAYPDEVHEAEVIPFDQPILLFARGIAHG